MSIRESNSSSGVSSRSTALVAVISQVPLSNDNEGSNVKAAARQITLTQTLTNDGTVTTAIVTLDRGTPPTETATTTPSDPESFNSGGMPSQTIGIIVGCSIGVVVLILLFACCCITMRRNASRNADGDDGDGSYMGSNPDVYPGGPGGMQRTPWRFPWSIPPPTLRPGEMPNYRTRYPTRQWTARDPAGRRYHI